MTAMRGAMRGHHDRPAAIGLAPRRGDRARNALTLAVPKPVTELSEALAILAARLHEAAAERRSAPVGSQRWRRAEERVAYVSELYLRLQRRMEIPTEIWSLGDGQDHAIGRRPARPRQ